MISVVVVIVIIIVGGLPRWRASANTDTDANELGYELA